jgi:hypothetical protein
MGSMNTYLTFIANDFILISSSTSKEQKAAVKWAENSPLRFTEWKREPPSSELYQKSVQESDFAVDFARKKYTDLSTKKLFYIS